MDIGYTGAFLGGTLTLLSPCSVMLLPAFFAYAFTSPSALIGRTVVFYAGLSATLIPLGVFSGTLGSLLTTHRMTLVAVAASVVILLGLWQLSGLPVPGLTRAVAGRGGERTSIGSVFALGSVYAVAGVCAGPILGSVLMVAAVGGNPVYGGSMLALYALGMTVPLFVLAGVWHRLGTRGRSVIAPKEVSIGPWRNTWAMVASGLLSVAIGVLLLLTEGTADLAGIVTISAQRSAESALSSWSSGVSDVWFVVAAALVLGGMILWRHRRGRRDSPAGPSSSTPDLMSTEQ